MTEAEIAALRVSAQAEWDADEDTMLIAPLALLGLLGHIDRLERRLASIGSYDQLTDG